MRTELLDPPARTLSTGFSGSHGSRGVLIRTPLKRCVIQVCGHSCCHVSKGPGPAQDFQNLDSFIFSHSGVCYVQTHTGLVPGLVPPGLVLSRDLQSFLNCVGFF